MNGKCEFNETDAVIIRKKTRAKFIVPSGFQTCDLNILRTEIRRDLYATIFRVTLLLLLLLLLLLVVVVVVVVVVVIVVVVVVWEPGWLSRCSH